MNFSCFLLEGSVNRTTSQHLNDTLNYLNHTYIIINKNLTWEESLTECLKNGYKLVSITDPYHQAFLTVTVSLLGHRVWIGLYSQDVSSYQVIFQLYFYPMGKRT